MNPFKESLGRVGFLLWSLVCVGLAFALAASTNGAKAHPPSIPLELLVLVVGLVVIVLYCLVFWRRLENAGLSRWFVVLVFIPFVATAAWLALLFIPPEKPAKKQKSIAE